MTNTIKSPFPGTFYLRPNPESDPYVAAGDDVNVGDVVGLVEIMKNFHEITSEESGRVARVLVENEALIEAGQDVIELA
ncbi:MAG: acetyl-CoA carboxylase [Gaiellaceae bacterium]